MPTRQANWTLDAALVDWVRRACVAEGLRPAEIASEALRRELRRRERRRGKPYPETDQAIPVGRPRRRRGAEEHAQAIAELRGIIEHLRDAGIATDADVERARARARG